MPNALTGKNTSSQPFTRNVFARQSRARHTRLSTEASRRHDRRRAGVHAGQSRVHGCAARSAQGTRGGVRPAEAHRGVPETSLSDVSSHPPPSAHLMAHPPHPPTRAGVVPLARRRRRHHDVRPRAVRPRRSVSPLSTCARASGLPKHLPDGSRANVRSAFSASRPGASRPGADRAR